MTIVPEDENQFHINPYLLWPMYLMYIHIVLSKTKFQQKSPESKKVDSFH